MKSVQPKHQRLFNQSQPQTDWKASGCLQFQPAANLGQRKVTPGRCRCCCGAQTDGCQDKHVSRITARGWISTKPSGLLADVGSDGGCTLPIHIMHMAHHQGRWCTLSIHVIHVVHPVRTGDVHFPSTSCMWHIPVSYTHLRAHET